VSSFRVSLESNFTRTARGVQALEHSCIEIVRTKDTGTLQYDIYSTTISSSASSTSGTGTPTRSSARYAPWRPERGNPCDGLRLRRTPR